MKHIDKRSRGTFFSTRGEKEERGTGGGGGGGGGRERKKERGGEKGEKRKRGKFQYNNLVISWMCESLKCQGHYKQTFVDNMQLQTAL